MPKKTTSPSGLPSDYKVPDHLSHLVTDHGGTAKPQSSNVDMSDRISIPYNTKSDAHRQLAGAGAMGLVKGVMVHQDANGASLSVPKNPSNKLVDMAVKASEAVKVAPRPSEKDSKAPAKKLQPTSPVKAVADKIGTRTVAPELSRADIAKLSPEQRRLLAARAMAAKSGNQRRSATGSTVPIVPESKKKK